MGVCPHVSCEWVWRPGVCVRCPPLFAYTTGSCGCLHAGEAENLVAEEEKKPEASKQENLRYSLRLTTWKLTGLSPCWTAEVPESDLHWQRQRQQQQRLLRACSTAWLIFSTSVPSGAPASWMCCPHSWPVFAVPLLCQSSPKWSSYTLRSGALLIPKSISVRLTWQLSATVRTSRQVTKVCSSICPLTFHPHTLVTVIWKNSSHSFFFIQSPVWWHHFRKKSPLIFSSFNFLIVDNLLFF